MMTVNVDGQLQERVRALEAELAERRRETAKNESQLEKYAADLNDTFKEERARAQELRRSYRLTVRALANAVEARDAYTGGHAERVAAYGLRLAATCGMQLGDDHAIEFGFLLHDVGKLAVPDCILFKPGPLTAEERLEMQQHPVKGWEIVRDIEFLGKARDVIRHHHERWDGTGYPDGLAGEAIPRAARIFAVADAFDALTTDRPYRQASTIAQARAIIMQSAGTHFDPAVTEVFESLTDEALERIRLEVG